MIDNIIGTQPFDDGFLAEGKLGGGSKWCDFLMVHPVDGRELVLRIFKNDPDGAADIAEQYKAAAAMSESLVGGCLKQKSELIDGDDYCLVEMYRNIDGKEMPTAAVARMGRDICSALAILQDNGYIHRNVKPLNICFCDGRYYLNSFDLMEKLDGCDSEYIVGTPAYMAPEAFDGECSMSTDLYALGITMYALLNMNELPFTGRGRSAQQAMDLRLKGNELPALPKVNPRLMNIILKACAFKPGDRYSDARELLEALDSYITSRSSSNDSRPDMLVRKLNSIDDFSRRWEINSVLGAGSYGVVLDVTDKSDNNRYAMKIVPISAEGEAESATSILLTRHHKKKDFEDQLSKASQEALVWSSISSCKSIVKLHESGRINDPSAEFGCYFYMCSELLSPIESDIRDERTVARIAADICSALVAIHGNNITHRDIKPGNILYSPTDGYKLGDFGIAKLHRFKADATVIGTLPYMPPEILRNYLDDRRRSEYDNSVDIYSLGLTMYRLLNRNRGPFIRCEAEDATDADFRNDNICRAKGKEFPDAEYASPAMMKIIRRACAYEPADRYTCAADMREALMDFLA